MRLTLQIAFAVCLSLMVLASFALAHPTGTGHCHAEKINCHD